MKTSKKINLHQLSKLNGVYRWTSTIQINKAELRFYKEDLNYLWVTDTSLTMSLTNTKIKG